MTDKDLSSQLEGLFSDAGLEPETEQSELLLEQAIVDLLGGEAEAELATAEPMTVEAPPFVPTKPEDAKKGHRTLASVRLWEAILIEQRTRILSTLMHGVTILGGVLLVFLLIRLIWPEPVTWPELYALYFAAYAVAVVIMLIQWMFNSSLSRGLQHAEEKHAKAVRSQRLLKKQAQELATANAVLQKRTLQLQTAAQISQAASSVLDLDELMQHAVKLVRERFDLYYVGLFLVDEAGADAGRQWAVLRAGTEEAGQRMVAQGHKFEVGGDSTIGWCIANAQVCIAPDPGAPSHGSPTQVNALLPGTRSQIVLPLRSRGRGIGALDVHSAEREGFSHEDIAGLQTVADQLAVAIDNAQLFAETRARLEELEEMEARHRRAVREQWTDSVSAQAAPSYERTRPGVAPLGEATTTEVLPTVAVPLSLRGEVIGTLGLHGTEGGRRWTDDEIALVEAVADQMALALENVRLLGETQQRAERERLIANITAQVRSSRDPETILRTAVRALGAALGTDRALVQLGTGTQPSDK